MAETPVDYTQALLYARQQHAHLNPPPQYGSDWHNDCQAFCHECYHVGGGFGSAYAQWLGLDPEDRHAGGKPADAPVGSFLFSKGSSPFGHIWLAARPFANGTPGSWSTNLVHSGRVDKVPRNAPMTVWGHTYLGYGTSINGYQLDLTKPVAAKPKQDKAYQRIQTAINNLETALTTAKKQKDAADVKMLNEEIARLKRMYSKLRHS